MTGERSSSRGKYDRGDLSLSSATNPDQIQLVLEIAAFGYCLSRKDGGG